MQVESAAGLASALPVKRSSCQTSRHRALLDGGEPRPPLEIATLPAPGPGLT